MCESAPEREAENYPQDDSREPCEIRRAFALAHPMHWGTAEDTPVALAEPIKNVVYEWSEP